MFPPLPPPPADTAADAPSAEPHVAEADAEKKKKKKKKKKGPTVWQLRSALTKAGVPLPEGADADDRGVLEALCEQHGLGARADGPGAPAADGAGGAQPGGAAVDCGVAGEWM